MMIHNKNREEENMLKNLKKEEFIMKKTFTIFALFLAMTTSLNSFAWNTKKSSPLKDLSNFLFIIPIS